MGHRCANFSLVAAYFVAWLSEDIEDLHAIAGYVVLGLICFRVVWGFIGTKHARFSDFIYSPAAIREYLKGLMNASPKHYLGHNPAGGIMVMLLLLSLFGATLSGLKVYGIEGHGPLAGIDAIELNTTLTLPSINPLTNAYADDDEHEAGTENAAEELWEEIHELFANVSLMLVFIHIGGVILSSMLHNENLVKAMITGRKALRDDANAPTESARKAN